MKRFRLTAQYVYCGRVNGYDIYSPVIPIKLVHELKPIEIFALIDSGSAICLFRNEIAEQLKINLEDCQATTIFGVGGSAHAHIHKVDIGINNLKYEIPVGFTQKLHYAGLLGFYGFFDRLSVFFSQEKRQIIIEGWEDKGKIVFPPK